MTDENQTTGKIPSMGPIQSMGPVQGYSSGNSFGRKPAGSQVIQSVWSIFSWLFDASFRDIRIHDVNRLFCGIAYRICWVIAILAGVFLTFWALLAIASFETFIPLFIVPFVWIGVVIIMFFVRLYFECCIIVLDWIVETTKAARIYTKNKNF